MSQRWPIYSAVAGFAAAGLAGLLVLGPAGMTVTPGGPPDAAGGQVAAHQRPAAAVAPSPASTAAARSPAAGADDEYEQLRLRLRWVQTRVGGDRLQTPDLRSRLLLAKSAAQRAGLHEVGLGFRDVYGLIEAETSWVPRTGASKDGTPNLGIAQFEPATARALGLRDPEDPVESVHVAARHMKEAALWSAQRLQGLKLGAGERAEKLREGVSIYYNLSTRGRAAWNGRNTRQLPVETRRHIANTRIGAQEAARLEAQPDAAPRWPGAEARLTADVTVAGG